MKISDQRIGFIGFGHMAQILFRSLDHSRLVPRSKILFVRKDPAKAKRSEQEFGITATSIKTAVNESDILLLCVRPQQVNLALDELSQAGASGKRIISILAGVQFAYLEKRIPSAFWIRAMPNLPAKVGEGMTALSYGAKQDEPFCGFAKAIFQAMGEVLVLPEEAIDLATGMAGSGPAYVFGLIDAIARLGEKEKISYLDARKMVAQTFLGAAKMLLEEPDQEIGDLIAKIAVPGGTTQAGWDVFQDLKLGSHFQSVILAAAKRSKEISQEFSH